MIDAVRISPQTFLKIVGIFSDIMKFAENLSEKSIRELARKFEGEITDVLTVSLERLHGIGAWYFMCYIHFFSFLI